VTHTRHKKKVLGVEVPKGKPFDRPIPPRKAHKQFSTDNGNVILYRDDEVTPISRVCLACHGHYNVNVEGKDGKYSIVRCNWCSSGLMNQAAVCRYLTVAEANDEDDIIVLNDDEIEDIIHDYLDEDKE
jgi:hypothetical protein